MPGTIAVKLELCSLQIASLVGMRKRGGNGRSGMLEHIVQPYFFTGLLERFPREGESVAQSKIQHGSSTKHVDLLVLCSDCAMKQPVRHMSVINNRMPDNAAWLSTKTLARDLGKPRMGGL